MTVGKGKVLFFVSPVAEGEISTSQVVSSLMGRAAAYLLSFSSGYIRAA